MQLSTHRLQLKNFRLILAIKSTGQLALAAEAMSISQPAASRMLASIEQHIGSKIFERHPKGMKPTAVGEVLARNALNLLRGVEETEREVRAVGAGLAGTARVGSVTGGAVAFVVPAIQELKKTATGADIHVEVASSDVLIEGLIKGEYDFILSRIPAGTNARLFSILRGRVETVHFLVREGHPLTGRKALNLANLTNYEWVVQAQHTPLRKALEETFISNNISPPMETVNTTSLLVTIAYLASSNAIAPISREVQELLAPETGGRGLSSISLEKTIIVKPYHLISYKGRTMSPLAAQLHELVFKSLTIDNVK